MNDTVFIRIICWLIAVGMIAISAVYVAWVVFIRMVNKVLKGTHE